jgi:RNA polymerase sigma-70 factor (ECF subfamily)
MLPHGFDARHAYDLGLSPGLQEAKEAIGPQGSDDRPATRPARSGIYKVMAQISDDVLWRRTARDDAEAFGELFDRHARRIYGFCFRQTGDWAIAQDLTSVTFLEAWRRRNSALIEEGKVVAWLLGIAHNTVRRQNRSRRRYRHALERMPAPPPVPDHADDSAARVAAEQQAAEVLAMMARLPRAQRMALALVMWEGLSPAEAAVALGKPEATVRSHLHRARRRLRAESDPESDPDGTALSPSPLSITERTGL